MKIRPKIPIYQMGNIITAPQWYIDRYGGRTALQGWDKSKRYNYANQSLMQNDHLNAGDLNTAYTKNKFYTDSPGAVSADIQSFYDSDGKGMTAEQFVKYYNDKAGEIRSHWAQDQTYGQPTAEAHNQLYQRMFRGRSNSDLTRGSDYNIGYQKDQEKIEGSSTWLRRMDQYENKFDPNNPDPNRIHEIKLSDGTTAKVYKTENGDIALLPQTLNAPPSAEVDPSKNQQKTEDLLNKLRAQETGDPPEKESFLNKLTQGFNKIAPELLEGIRLAGALGTNSRVLAESEKAVIPNLQQTYQTHRQIVGDEATKQAYYRRAAQGQTQAAKPFTSDADRQMAYMMEAKRVGDELRAQGDLADNQEIRRTSDESNQHQWANTQRATEVANSNITELNKAAAAKHQLRAQKYLADWTNIDQYLLGRQAKIDQKRNKDLAYQQQLQLLEDQHEIATDEKLQRLKAEADAAYDTYYNNPTNTANYNTYKAKLRAYQDYQYEVQKRILSRRQFAKSGTKIEYKDKTAKYLYKTSKDIVEHFRRMSKMTDDSRIRTLPKPIKLSSHPRKMQMGGIAPFYIYRPYMSGMEQSMSSQVSASGTSSSSSSKKDNEGKDKLDMIKELFKAIQGQGLPIDVSTVYQDISKVLSKAKAFGEDLSTDDIASMYLNSMLKINNLKYSKDVFDKAKAQATANDALNEYAVTAGGALVLQNKEGEVKLGTYQDYVNSKGKWNPITNDQLLNLRAYSPNMALFKGDELMQIVNNGVGMTKIAAQIKSMASTLGSSEQKIEGISEVENKRIKSGLQILAGTDGTPDGFYKVTQDKKDSSTNVKAALTYIYNMLPTNYKTVLKMHSGSEDNSKALIASMLTSQVSDYYKEDVAPLTGKASDKDLGSGGKGDISSNPLLAMQREIGGMYQNYSLVTKDSNTKLSVNGTFYSQLPKISEDMSIDKMLSVSGIGGIIQGKRGITFGNQEIKPEDLKHIMYSNNGGMVVTLPCKIVNGIKQVNLDVVETYEKAEQKALQVNSDRNSPQFIQALAQELKNEHLDSLLDSNGLPNKNMFGQFLVVEAYTSDKTKFDINSKYVEKIENPDEELEQRMSKALSTDNKKSDYALDVKDHWTIFEGTWDDIYKGTVFIPLNNNPNAALNTWGNSAKIGQTTELEELYQISNKSSKFNGNNTLE